MEKAKALVKKAADRLKAAGEQLLKDTRGTVRIGGGGGKPPSKGAKVSKQAGQTGGSGGHGSAPKAVVPQVADPKLKNYVSDLYKGAKGPNPIGTGSTADAVRNELTTGLPTHGTFHSDKAQQYIKGLTKWLRNNPNASHHDRLVAQSLLDDLKAALGGN